MRKDDLSPVLEEMKSADGLAFASPVYFMNISGALQSALERMIYPWGSYKDGAYHARRVPTATFYTMNAKVEDVESFNMEQTAFGRTDWVIAMCWSSPERVMAYNTCQVKDYRKYDLQMFHEEAKRVWRDTHFEDDKKHAFLAGGHMARKILMS